jgi:cell division protein FtsB
VSSQTYWNKIYRAAALAAFGLAAAGVVFAFFPKVVQLQSYQKTRDALADDIRTKEEAIKDLRRKQEQFSTDKLFVQQMAHEIGYAHEGETVFQFREENGSNRPPETTNE